MNTVEDYLKQIARWQRSLGFDHSLEQFCLTYGREWNTSEFTLACARGEIKMCFVNASNLTLRNGRIWYVEGYAQGIIPTLHAWCVEKHGTVLDPTWRDPAVYWGVPFDEKFLTHELLRRGVYGLLEMNDKLIGREFPPELFLAEPWQKEILSRDPNWWLEGDHGKGESAEGRSGEDCDGGSG